MRLVSSRIQCAWSVGYRLSHRAHQHFTVGLLLAFSRVEPWHISVQQLLNFEFGDKAVRTEHEQQVDPVHTDLQLN
jgi:hypothetical protein